MNLQSLKQAQTCLDEAIAAIVYAQVNEIYPQAQTLRVWHSALDTARLELIEFAASLRPVTDVSGVVCGGE